MIHAESETLGCSSWKLLEMLSVQVSIDILILESRRAPYTKKNLSAGLGDFEAQGL